VERKRDRERRTRVREGVCSPRCVLHDEDVDAEKRGEAAGRRGGGEEGRRGKGEEAK
jgi:hypothetical protein